TYTYNASVPLFASGQANANALGVVQDREDGAETLLNLSLDNSGSINALAVAEGDSNAVHALAIGALAGGGATQKLGPTNPSAPSSEGQSHDHGDVPPPPTYLNQVTGQMGAVAIAGNAATSEEGEGASPVDPVTAMGWDFEAGSLTGTATNNGEIW